MMDEELTAHAEKSDGYHGVIIRLNALWRVAVCDARIQWSSASRATGIRLASSWATRRTADGLQLANPQEVHRGAAGHAAPSPRNAPRGPTGARPGRSLARALA